MGRLDYVFNNAGIIVLGEIRDLDLTHWRRLIGINLLGVLYGTTCADERMLAQGHGHIVNIASVSGLIPMPIYAAYAATKHAVVGLSTSLRAEAAKLGVKVTVVCPGPLNTGLSAAATLVHASRETLDGRQKKREGMDPAAARVILRGVGRNKRLIVFPFSARLLWWLHRLHPALLTHLERWVVATFRAARTDK